MKRVSGSGYRVSGVLMALAVAQAAVACPVCFGSPDSSMTKGASAGIWVLLGVIGFVQLGFVALFATFWKRARDLRKRKEQFHLIHGGVH